jgi:predicted transcriptional regulator
VYQPLLQQGETEQLLLKRFMQTAFEGSAMKLVMQALGNHRASKEEILEIRGLLDKLEGGDR